VAELHLRCMTEATANGERFLAVSGDFMSIQQIAKVLKASMGEAAKRVPTNQIPDLLVRLAALGDPAVQQILPELGKFKNGANAKAREFLGWSPRTPEDALTASAESLVRLGLLKDSPKKAA
jgi:nucleoside-diphosphate-sugar epimerase